MHNSAPLTKRDVILCLVGVVVAAAVTVGLIALLLTLRRKIAFSEAGTVAVARSGYALLAIPLYVVVFAAVLKLFINKTDKKIAAFVEKEAQAEASRSFEDELTLAERRKKRRRIALTVWCVGLVASLLLAVPSVFCRTTLSADGCLRRYDALNARAAEAERFSSAALEISLIQKEGERAYRRLAVTVETPEGMTTFRSDGGFADDLDEVLAAVESVADRAERFTVRNAADAEALCESLHMTEGQIARFNALLARAE